MSSMVDMTAIATSFKDVPLDAFVIRAAAKALVATSPDIEQLSVTRVFNHQSRVTYTDVQDLRVNQIVQSGVENGAIPAGQPLIQVQ